jgi:TPR repeat protein
MSACRRVMVNMLGPRSVLSRCVVLMAAIVCLSIASGAARAEPRVALVIGNANYAVSKLKNPRNDAGLMARTLAATGFDVMTVMDGDVDAIRRAIADFGTKLQTPGAVALFYYAGHGVQVDGDNYLIPLGATFASTEDVSANAVPLDSVMRTMARSNTRLNIVVLDACRDNPFTSAGWTATVYGLASVVAPADTIIAYATGPGQLADDGIGSNSPYTAALASEMTSPGATLEDVFRATRRHVLERTGQRQLPWEHSSLVSQFSFLPKTVETGSINAASVDRHDTRQEDLAYWNTIKASNDATVLQDYVRRYPDGLFVELAKMRLARIEAVRMRMPWSWIPEISTDASAQFLAAMAAFDKARTLDRDGAPPSDLATAMSLYIEAAAEGLPSAMYYVGRGYDKGRGVPRDILEAARWYERSSNTGYPPAMAALGTMHEFGEGAAPDLTEALRLYRLAADGGDAGGMTSLAFLYSQGKGVARDAGQARRLYLAAVRLGNSRAMYNLALMDIQGSGGPTNLPNAHALLQQSAERGHAGALLELARLYDRGLGVSRDPSRAADFALKAVQAGHREGRFVDIVNQGWSFAMRRQVQKQLAAKGLYDGGIHGFFNAATRDALVAVAAK